MSVNWTERQKQVIESRGVNLLVSAAAGSGKTAVLVERIIRMITEGEHPLDIDRLLVMTFTNAAAAEMRERIGAAIEQKLAAQPDNEHLQLQSVLVHHARITTIDSFCLNLIREHFNLLDLDPAFSIGDEGELMLLRQDVMAELLEDYYEAGEERFIRFVETYGQGKSDAGIEAYIQQVDTFAQSNPYPAVWFDQCMQELDTGEVRELEQFSWMRFLMTDIRRQARELQVQLSDALAECQEDPYLCAYEPMLREDLMQLGQLEAQEHFVEMHRILSGFSWARLATVRSKEADPEKKAYVTGCRDRAKKTVNKMKELFCFAQPEEQLADLVGTGETVRMLLELAQEYSRRYQEKKRDRNLVDFNDLEHEALKVLIRSENGRPVLSKDGKGVDGSLLPGYQYTEAADTLSMQFEEVLVDEYQDSNLVQEALLQAVSRERFGKPNVFMVGDVKQSIYRFRLARPELFQEKYHTYSDQGDEKDAPGRKIELHQNFRSRGQVLDGINDVFFKIMTENLGNICYTEETALHAGAQFPEMEPGAKPPEEETEKAKETAADARLKIQGPHTAGIPKLLLVDTGDAALSQLDEEAADYTAKELEAKLIVSKIREMTDPRSGLLVWDKTLEASGGYRICQYRDIVILLRSTAGWTETLLSVLMNEGIPAYAESRMGYFTTLEVETVLSFLSVIDNPMQDIPLTAVLKAPFGGVSDQELAQVMAAWRRVAQKGQDRGIYGAVRSYLERHEDALAKKLSRLMKLVERFRAESVYLPIHQLIYRIYEETGYYDYAAAMPAGETRRANLDMLVEKAADYEKTSYKGLFHFIRYIENLKKYNTDFGEASTAGEDDNTVRIMSIHKSKGLEFPVVFLSGMGKKFNRQDLYGKLLIDADLGVGTDYLDLEHRLKTTTLKKNVLRRKLELDSLGEELRVLYVAMTRAKEQLIMTGTDRYLEKSLEKYARIPLAGGQVPYTILASAGSYLDWLLMCMGGGQTRIRLVQVPVAELVGEELVRQVRHRRAKEELLKLDTSRVYHPEYREQLEQCLGYRYPYEADRTLHTKMSVSELKMLGQMMDEAESARLEGLEETDRQMEQETDRQAKQVPSAASRGASASFGATRGTAYHRAMELLDFTQVHRASDVEKQLLDLVEQGRFTKEAFGLIRCGVLWRFLQSELGRRMTLAQAEGRLHKEQQFVMGIPARELGFAGSEELVVIQGIMDAYFEEQGQLVLVDYKTDHVKEARTLIDRYQKQLDYYERALAQMTGKPVKEKIIYSLGLNREIRL